MHYAVQPEGGAKQGTTSIYLTQRILQCLHPSQVQTIQDSIEVQPAAYLG